MFGMMMGARPKCEKANMSLITPEVQDVLTRKGIDPDKYVVYSGLIQVSEIMKDHKLSKKDKITLAKYSVDIEKQLVVVEKLMFDTVTKLFADNPLLEVHKMNFPILDSYVPKMLNEQRQESLKLAEKDLDKLLK